MPKLTGKLVEVFQLGEERAGVLDLPRTHWPVPGQYLPAQRLSGDPEVLTTALFPVIGDPNHLCVATLPDLWTPSDILGLQTPQGRGFSLPPSARRVALGALNGPPSRLLPLISPALAQNAAVALFSEPLPDPDLLRRMPSSVEVGPLSALLDNLDWPDFLALDLPATQMERLNDLLSDDSLPFTGQALLRTAMPCHGVGECGVCAVKTRRGWQMACQDGPVFPLEEVLHVA